MAAPRSIHLPGLLIAGAFVALGSLWIGRPGPEYDEVRFVLATYPDRATPVAYTMHFGGRPVPLMIVSYMGALKGWLYVPILKVWPGSVAAARLPMLLIAAAALYCFYLFVCRAFGRQTGLVALALAATDPIYLFTSRLDWGPVAIQHFCLLAGLLALWRWWQKRRLAHLALGFFLMGLGIFDKATFLWLLAALAAAVVILFPLETRRTLQMKPLTVAVAALLIGAAPFVYYCWKWPGESFRRQPEPPSHYLEKLRTFQYVLQGSPLAPWISRDVDGAPAPPPDLLARFVFAVAPRSAFAETLLLPAAVLALLLLPAVPFHPFGRGMLFALLFCALAFIPMMVIREAGWVHHIALVLPFPQLFVAAGLVGAKEALLPWLVRSRLWRIPSILLWSLVLVLAAANLRAVAHHYFRVLGYGGSAFWTEAIYQLDESIEKRNANPILLLDWNMLGQLRLLSAGQLPVVEVAAPRPGADERAWNIFFARPAMVAVKHVSAEAVFPEVADAFLKSAAARGYRVEATETVTDPRGRRVYEILSLRRH